MDHPAVKDARYYDLQMACRVLASFDSEDWESLTPQQQNTLYMAATRIIKYAYRHPYEQTEEQ